MVPLIFPSLNNRSRFRGVSSSSVRWSSHGGHVLDVELFVSNRRKRSKFFFRGGEPREDGARRRKVKQNFRALKTLEKGGLLWSLRPKRLQKKTSLFFSWGKKRVFETFFSTKERKIFYLFFK